MTREETIQRLKELGFENPVNEEDRIDLIGANLRGAYLSSADMTDAHLLRADLYSANLSDANLIGANLNSANLVNANLIGANLVSTFLGGAILIGANLNSATLYGSDLYRANLRGADLTGAALYRATFGNVDLREAKGLETIIHDGPSLIGIDTIYRSQGQIPEAFLRGAGVPDEFINYMSSLVGRPIEYYSCFISYSSEDQECAERLHNDLQGQRVRCWYAPKDLPIGARTRPSIDEAIRSHDKLLLILSETSVRSQWVEQEVESALEKERQAEGKTVLFPVRIDDTVMSIDTGWPKLIRNTRNIGDFTQWKDHDAYQVAFDRLLRDLKAGSRAES